MIHVHLHETSSCCIDKFLTDEKGRQNPTAQLEMHLRTTKEEADQSYLHWQEPRFEKLSVLLHHVTN